MMFSGSETEFGCDLLCISKTRCHLDTGARFPVAARIASIALGEGPSGFSFEASLMIACGSTPSSRAVSSIGFPGS